MNKKMTHIIKQLVMGLVFTIFSYTQVSEAVFCTAHKYTHPETGKTIWIFGDVHCDIEPTGAIVRVQQHALLQMAQQHEGLVIAENIEEGAYNPYMFASLLAFDIVVLSKLLKDQRYRWAALAGYFTVGHAAGWAMEYKKTKKPDVVISAHLDLLRKQYAPETGLPLYRFSPLFCLASRCRQMGIQVIDAEFRFHPVPVGLANGRKLTPGIGKIVYAAKQFDYWYDRTMTGNKVMYPMTVGDYQEVNDGILQEISTYDDNPILQTFFQTCIATYKNSYMTQALREYAMSNPTMSLVDAYDDLVKKSDKHATAVKQDFHEHNKELLDARVVNYIYQNRETQHIFVCVGADHEGRIADMVEKLGYQATLSYGKDGFKRMRDGGMIGRNYIQVKDLDCIIVDLEKFFAQASVTPA